MRFSSVKSIMVRYRYYWIRLGIDTIELVSILLPSLVQTYFPLFVTHSLGGQVNVCVPGFIVEFGGMHNSLCVCTKTDKFWFVTIGTRTIHRWRSACAQSHSHLCAFGTRTICEQFGSQMCAVWFTSVYILFHKCVQFGSQVCMVWFRSVYQPGEWKEHCFLYQNKCFIASKPHLWRVQKI